ncbi:hypothetical protein WDV76_00485 [Xenorhabdus griffiniae]|uniref:hypothetical protein n=1 Tax=Xenorhabdus griffiniae TaxID=351672 RepID=UPI0030D05219
MGMDGKAANTLSPQSVCAHLIGYHVQAMKLGIGDITLTQESVPAHLHACNITPVSPDLSPSTTTDAARRHWETTAVQAPH